MVNPDSRFAKEDRIAFAALAVSALALIVRAVRLDHFSLWLDEIMQVSFTCGSWKDFWHSIRYDAAHPPLDYLFHRFLGFLHPSDACRKLLPAVWGTGTVFAAGCLVRRRFNDVAGVVAALLLALAPFHVRYSQEIRPYSLGLLTLVLALLALDRYLEHSSPGRLVVLYCCCVATAYSLYLSILALAVAGSALLIEDAMDDHAARRLAARRFLVRSPAFAAAAVLAYLPWAPVLLTLLRRPSPPGTSPMPWQRLPEIISYFCFTSFEGVPIGPAGLAFLVFVVGGLVCCALRRRARFFAFWLVGAGGLIVMLNRVHPSYDVSRYFLPAGIALPILAGCGFGAIWEVSRRPTVRWIVASILVGFLASDVVGLRRYFEAGRPDWRPLASYLLAYGHDEIILTENGYLKLCVAYYVAGPTWLQQRQGPRRRIKTLEENLSGIDVLWPPRERAWLVLGGTAPEAVGFRDFARDFYQVEFPTAELSARVVWLIHPQYPK